MSLVMLIFSYEYNAEEYQTGMKLIVDIGDHIICH